MSASDHGTYVWFQSIGALSASVIVIHDNAACHIPPCRTNHHRGKQTTGCSTTAIDRDVTMPPPLRPYVSLRWRKQQQHHRLGGERHHRETTYDKNSGSSSQWSRRQQHRHRQQHRRHLASVNESRKEAAAAVAAAAASTCHHRRQSSSCCIRLTDVDDVDTRNDKSYDSMDHSSHHDHDDYYNDVVVDNNEDDDDNLDVVTLFLSTLSFHWQSNSNKNNDKNFDVIPQIPKRTLSYDGLDMMTRQCQ